MRYVAALETRTTESGAEAFDSALRAYHPGNGWIWGARHIAHALDLNERYLVNSATPGFFIAMGVNTVCPVSSWDPSWGRDRILLTHINSLEAWWGNRDEAIYVGQIKRAGAARESKALAALGRTDQSSGSVVSP
jgi:hypothetical protein